MEARSFRAGFLFLTPMKKILAVFTLLLLITSCQEPESANSNEKETGAPPPAQDIPPTPRTGDLAKIDSLSRLLRDDPDNLEAYLMRAELLLKRKEARSAANDIYNAMQLDSNSARARSLKGQLHFVQNRTRLSKREWERCIELDPENIECRLRLAELYIIVMDFKAALKLLDKVISLDDDNAQAYFLKGIVVRDMRQDTSLALQYFQRAVDLKQDYVKALDMMGVMLSAQNDTLAKFYFQRILELEPNRGDIYFKLGVYHMNQDNINRAIESFTRAVQLSPRDAESYFNLGFIHIQLKEYEQASKYFTSAIQVREKNYKAYYGRGYCYEMGGQYKKAKADYLQAIESNPIYKPAGEGLQRVNEALAELEAAGQ